MKLNLSSNKLILVTVMYRTGQHQVKNMTWEYIIMNNNAEDNDVTWFIKDTWLAAKT